MIKTEKGKAIIIGANADRGLGAQLSKRFASEGLEIFVGGRTKSALQSIVRDIESADGKANAVVADATNESDIHNLFKVAGKGVELAIFNVGNNTPGSIVDMTAEYFEKSWRDCCYAGFLFGREAVRTFLPEKRGTLIFTGASASLRGRANFGAFNSAKGGLRQLAQAMAKEYGGDGIHVSHVVVDGVINGQKIRDKRPELIKKMGEDKLLEIDGIVESYVYLYRQQKNSWTFELDIRNSKERW